MKLTYTILGFIMLWVADLGGAVLMTATAILTGEWVLLLAAVLCIGCGSLLLGFIQELTSRWKGGP